MTANIDRFFLGEITTPYYRDRCPVGTPIPREHKSKIEAVWTLNGLQQPCLVVIPNHSYRCAMVELEFEGETIARVAFNSDLRPCCHLSTPKQEN